MTYYEELGLTPTASTEAIRQAYKNVARLWHPDQFQDEKLREAAECQMKRLNHVVAVLTDPIERMHYDADVEAAKRGIEIRRAPPPPLARGDHAIGDLFPFLNLANLAWAVIGLIALVSVLAFLLTPGGQTQIPRIKEEGARNAEAPVLKPESRSSGRPPSRGHQREKSDSAQAVQEQAKPPAVEAAAELPAIAEFAAPPSAGGMRPGDAGQEIGSAKEATAPAASSAKWTATPTAPPANAGTPATTPRLAGNWFYVRTKDDPPAGFYPPEYIELKITAEAGSSIEGSYRARYRILDRPISPEVVFQFRGPMSSGTARYPWSAPNGGAKGEVQLKPVSAVTLEVNWWATELGNNPGLASGTAVLVRQQEP
jgi:curved DNA-binding protein CbpA